MKIKDIREFFMSSWAIDNRVTTYVLTVIVTLLGVMSFNNLPKENFPEIAVPTIFVGTPWPGNSPENVEQNISRHIEKEIKAITGLKKVKSQSVQDMSIVIAEFETNVDIEEAKDEVEDAVANAKQNLPTDLPADPQVQDINLSEFPIMFINVSGDLSDDVLKEYSEDLQDAIETLPEIRRVDLLGVREKEVQVDLDLYKMQANGIAFGDVENAIRQRDVLITGGNVTVGGKEYTVQSEGKFKQIDDMKKIVVRNSSGASLRLGDIADVRLGYKKMDSYARLEGLPTISLSVIKKAGENLVSASEKIAQELEKFQTETLPVELRDKFKIKMSADQSYMTKNMLTELTNTIVIGFLLVTIVLMFFMGVRDAMFVGLSVPLSSMIAFVVLPWLGFTLNLVVLFTFIFALGIVVDNAIVVIENTYRLYNQNKVSIAVAAKKAAGEVIAPVFAGTLTTMAPFLPLAFWEGIIGEFMFFMPVTIIIVLFASLLVAYVINPVFAVTFMKRDDEVKPITLRGFLIIIGVFAVFSVLLHLGEMPVGGNIFLFAGLLFALYRFVLHPAIRFFQDRILPWMMNIYRNVLRWSLRKWHPYAVLGGTIFLLFFSFGFFGANPPKVVFFPEADPNFMYIYTQLPIGTGIERTNNLTKRLETIVDEEIGEDKNIVKSIITNVAKGAGSPQDFNQTGVYAHKSRIQVEFVPFKERGGTSTADILERVRYRMREIPGAVITVEKEASGPPTEKPINIEVRGDDFWEIKDVAEDLKAYLDSLVDVGTIVGPEALKWDIELDKPELRVDIDYVKAGELGMNVAQIGMALRTAIFGSELTDFRQLEDEYPIMVRLDQKYRDDVDALMNMNISYRDMSTGMFHNVPIRSVATITDTVSFGGINRLDLKNVIVIGSNILTQYNPNEVVTDVIYWMDEWKSKNERRLGNVAVEMTGQMVEQAETSAFLGNAMMASLILIFLILISQFNSVGQVMIIFSQIIFSLTGVLLGFAGTGMDMSIVMVGVGMVSLAGIVVNNGIILLDFIKIMRDRGYKTRQSIIEGGATRFTPVLLTASSTVLGLMPLAFALNINFGSLFRSLDPQIFLGGDTAVFWGPLSWTIIFGLGFATIVTLVVVPVMYYLFYTGSIMGGRKIRRIRQRIGRLLTS